MTRSSSPSLPQLCNDAEDRLASASPADAQAADKLLRELQVQQVELEMQNQSLREAQIALKESRDRYADLYEFAPLGYLTLNDAGVIAEINLAGAKLLGEVRGMLLSSPFKRFVAAADEQEWHQFFLRAFLYADPQTCEIALKRGDGTVFNVRLDCLLTLADDDAPALRIALSDITEIKQAMARLRASEERMRLAKNAAAIGIYDRDIASGKLEWDERSREIWGVGADEPVSYATFMAGVHPDDRAVTQAAVDRALDPLGGGDYSCEYRVVNRADGGIRHVAANGRALFEDGRAVRIIGALRDVTGRKRAEKELQGRRSEMDLLVKQQVAAHTAAAIAHELNQPLVSISAYSEAALRMLRSGTKNPEKLARALEGAMVQAQRAGKTLHELLDFLHRGDAALEPVDLIPLADEALVIVVETGYGGFRPVLEFERDLPPVLANRLQVQKVLVNLLHNAVEAMRLAGLPADTITIAVRSVAEQGVVQVTVRDSGPGLDGDSAAHIFDPFFSTKQEGLGLGLAISRALIEAHGGRLWADQQTGCGATFHFTLPIAS